MQAYQPSSTPTRQLRSSRPCGAQYNLQLIYETPTLSAGVTTNPTSHGEAEFIISTARTAGRTILTEIESKRIVASYGIPTIETQLAETEDDAVVIAQRIGFPVVLKLHSLTITHKTDVGGVRLELTSDDAVQAAFRAIRTSVTDARRSGPFSRSQRSAHGQD